MQRAFGPEHLSQGAEPGVRIGEVVKNAGADDVVEPFAELARALDGKMAHLKIVEFVFALELQLVCDAIFAEVDSHDARPRPADGVVRCLRRAAARDEDASVVAIGLVRPEEMRIGTPAIVVPSAPVGFEIVDRRRVGMTFVKRGHPPANRAFHTDSIRLGMEKALPIGACDLPTCAAFLFAPSPNPD